MSKITVKQLVEHLIENKAFSLDEEDEKLRKVPAHGWISTTKSGKSIRIQLRKNKGEGVNHNITFEFWKTLRDEEEVDVGVELYKAVTGREIQKAKSNFASKDNIHGKKRLKPKEEENERKTKDKEI